MPVIALEEHFVTPELEAAWDAVPPDEADPMEKLGSGAVAARLRELGAMRITEMDRAGVDVAILSVTTPGVHNLAPDIAVPMARDLNDFTAATVRLNPARFGGFALVPTPDPKAAAHELERAMALPEIEGVYLYGRTRERRLDDPALLPVWEAAASCGAPVYIHPQVSTRPVREQLYGGFARNCRSLSREAGSAGITRRGSRSCGWCWRACSTVSPSCRSSPAIGARRCCSTSTGSTR